MKDSTKISPGTSRRTLVKGVAWSVPMIAASATVPAYAASLPCSTGIFTAPSPGNGQAKTVTTWVVPEGVRRICFSISGGGGGRSYNYLSEGVGGSGALIEGQLSVTPGQKLTLVVGAGGVGYSTTAATGGDGYGKGGDVIAKGNGNYGASGGGSSALLLDNKVIVVAGGGGGGSNQYGSTASDDRIQNTNNKARWGAAAVGKGGGAGSAGTTAINQMATYTASTITSYAGGAGNNGSGGSAGTAGPLQKVSEIIYSREERTAGKAGTAGFTGAGGDAVASYSYLQGKNATYSTTSGAGGGGYGGGGSGASSSVSCEYPNGQYGPEYSAISNGGGGGGGGSFVDSSVENSKRSLAGNGATERSIRYPGAISINY